jgi:hypothetical protein
MFGRPRLLNFFLWTDLFVIRPDLTVPPVEPDDLPGVPFDPFGDPGAEGAGLELGVRLRS